MSDITDINGISDISDMSDMSDKKDMINKTYQNISVKTEDDIVTICLNRPDKKNAMSFAMMHELIDCASWLKTDRTVRVIVLAGAGDVFCAGIDLNDLNQPKNKAFALWELAKPWQSLFQRVCLIWQDMPVPVIACLHGHCIGAGLQLALACDIRLATPDCKLSLMEAKWGLVPDMGLTQSARQLMPVDILKELAMTARVIDGDTAKTFGLITHLSVDPKTHANDLANELASRSPDAVLASKRIINAMSGQSHLTLYQEKLWQLKLLMGNNRKLALKKARKVGTAFAKRQFR